MNRTFLIVLMIATAMMIAVIGQQKPASHLDNVPWEVDLLDNGSTRVFGLTLDKTSIQESNQIIASFAETLLLVNDDQSYQLIARYNELTIGGLIAQLQLVYKLDQQELKLIYDTLDTTNEGSTDKNRASYKLDKKTEMSYLSTPIASVTYTPSIDYGEEIIRQRFGQPKDEQKINDDELLWLYPELGLKIHIHANKADEFIYSSLK